MNLERAQTPTPRKSAPPLDPKSFSEKRLERATRHVVDLWFPPNPEVLKRIKTGLEDGSYELDISFLISEIKSDFSIFVYCLRQLGTMLKEQGLKPPAGLNPVEMLRFVGLDALKAILLVDERQISKHTLGVSNELQSRRTQEAFISASTAEVLCEHEKIDGELGFSCGLLRQLGYTLIAWNYPTVYRRVFSGLTESQSLDNELSKALGFSPMLLAMTVVRKWGLGLEVETALGIPAEDPQSESKIGKILEKFCTIGEALARANDPDHYPTARSDWELARVEIETRLGREGFKFIQEKVKDHLEDYVKLLPNFFKATIELDPEQRVQAHAERTLLKNNPNVEHCFPALKARFKELYAHIYPGSVSRENLRFLVKNVIPLAGFSGGAIFTLDPGTMELTPRLKLGSVVLRELEPLRYSVDFPNSDPIVTAYRLDSPIMESMETEHHGAVTFFAGVVGTQERTGVLYLEVPSELMEDPQMNSLLHFKAIRQALNDCLGLS